MGEMIHKRRHRIILDVTFKHGHTYSEAVDTLLHAIHDMDRTEVQLIRPLDYRKVLTQVARIENNQIKSDIEMAIDAL